LTPRPDQITISEAQSWYPEDEPTHGFAHILRVYALCERIGEAEGADLRLVRAAALLHDAEGEEIIREEHHLASAVFAAQVLREKNWPEDDIAAVQHCIRAHRFRDQEEQPRSIEARVLYDADKLDAIGAVGVVRAFAYAITRGESIYQLPSRKFRETGVREPDEPHTPYHEFLFKLQHIKDRLTTPTGKALAVQRHRFLVHFFQEFEAEQKGLR
jgi:uncharacterized protein